MVMKVLSVIAFLLWLVVLGLRIYDHDGLDRITDAGLIVFLLFASALNQFQKEETY